MKYVGIWWGMHIGKLPETPESKLMTWASGPRHGATTGNAKRYIDFAAANGLGGVLVEGWNVGWDGDWIKNRNAFSFTQAYPDYDLREVARYAHEKGVKLIVHNETSGGIENYERQLDSAFALYHSLGLDAVKSGYVSDLTSEGHSHHGQVMVRHYRKVIETAAQYGIMLDVHENYAHQPAFQFIRDVAVDWDTTRVLEGKIGDYVVVARRERNGPSWFIGAITDEEGRTFDIPLSFLTPGRRYVAEIYADGPGAHWLTNLPPVAISRRPVPSTTPLHVVLAPGGGQAIRIRPAR